MNIITNDSINITLELNNSKENLWNSFKNILEILENSIFPKPKKLLIEDKDEISISSYMDLLIKSETEKITIGSFQIYDRLNETHIVFSINYKNKAGCNIKFSNKNIISASPAYLKELFKKLILTTKPIFAEVSFWEHSKNLFKEKYANKERTFFSPGLYWLQYYAAEELRRQGGIEAIEKNPYIKSERIGEGLLVQVGESIYDSLTPEGEALLVKATEAMPPASWK
jgi:hypothetical protein